MNTMNCPPVIQRGLFPDSKEQCLYFIQFKDCSSMGIFGIQLMSPTTWHYDEANPDQSYFEKGSEKRWRFPINECIIQRIQDADCLIVAGRDGDFLIIGLAICPTDPECYLAISQEWSSDDDLLLKRKRSNQQKQKMISKIKNDFENKK